MAAALKPRLKALQACEPLSPLLSFLLLCPRHLLSASAFFFVPTHFLHPRYRAFWTIWWNESEQKLPIWLGALFVCVQVTKTETWKRRSGGGVRRLAGLWASSNIKVCSMFSATHPIRRRDKCVGLPGAGWCNKVARWLIFQTEKVKIGAKKKKKNPYTWRFYVWGVRTRKIE